MAFLDPPYGMGLAERALAALRDGGWLAAGALCIVEETSQAQLAPPQGFEILDRRDYGGTQLVTLRFGAVLPLMVQSPS